MKKAAIKTNALLAQVADVTEQLLTAPSFSFLIELAIKSIFNQLSCKRVEFLLFDRQTWKLVAESYVGLPLARKEKPRIEITDDVARCIYHGGEVIALDDAPSQKFMIIYDHDLEECYCCEMRVPLQLGGDLIGVLNIGAKTDGTKFSVEEIDYIRVVLNSISGVCQNFSLGMAEKIGSADASLPPTAGRSERPYILLAKDRVTANGGLEEIIGASPALERIIGLVNKVAEQDVPVLITGESGTGKELVARAIHRKSKRHRNPLVAMNCAALPEGLVESELFGHEKGAFTGAHQQKKGKFEFAHQSTLFLDEIADMSIATQAKLLRVLQDGRFQRVGGNTTLHADVRLISATNKNLKERIREGHFREDLFYRINLVQIEIPPLRERKDDIPILAYHFFEYFRDYYHKRLTGMDQEVIDWLLTYEFPGNARELKNIIERGVIMEHHDRITLAMMPTARARTNDPVMGNVEDLTLEELERRHIRAVLERAKYNKSVAARSLGIARKTLREKMTKYDLHSGS